MANNGDLKEAKVTDQINYDFLKKVESPVADDLYLRYIQEKNLTYYRKLLGEMKKGSRDLLDSGLFERASAKIKRLIEKERKKKKTPPAAAEEEQKDNDVAEKEPAEEDKGDAEEEHEDHGDEKSAKRSKIV
ncbi:unnamed protein product [Microthlaspi erraticum]|uniref:Uncharacterized protein n=1 Tax=Microthlaspi erraticum TaxID=1685480 RepID=A0A6D2JSP5_9BRAS|nr:unnamed protein product [Microthlaspi erraticum]